MAGVHIEPWAEIWSQVKPLNGWVSTFGEAQEVRKRHESASSLKFIGHKKTTKFGVTHFKMLQEADIFIRFADHKEGIVGCDRIPFIVLGKYTLGCIFGRDKNEAAKERVAEERDRELKISNMNKTVRDRKSKEIRKAVSSREQKNRAPPITPFRK